MGCNSSSILKKNTQVKLTPNDFVDFVIDRFNFKELLDKDISFQGEDYFWNDIQFNANNISFFPHFMIKIINLRINNFDDFFCIIFSHSAKFSITGFERNLPISLNFLHTI